MRDGLRLLAGLTLVVVCLGGRFLSGAGQARQDTEVKATFLLNFAQFVTWPPNSFPHPRAPIVIGILGDDPFGPVLDDRLRGQTAGQRRLVVRRFRRAEDATAANIVFINLPTKRSTSAAIAALRDRPVLTVSDSDEFCLNGGMIRFFPEGQTIRFQINPTAATTSGLTISSRLMRVAEIFEAPPAR